MRLLTKISFIFLPVFALAGCGEKAEQISYEKFIEIAKNMEIPNHKSVEVEISTKEENKARTIKDGAEAEFKDQFGKWTTDYIGKYKDDFIEMLNFRPYYLEDSEKSSFYSLSKGGLKAKIVDSYVNEETSYEIDKEYVFDKYGQVIEFEGKTKLDNGVDYTIYEVKYEASYKE